uniref:S1-like domain-containing protein n=1 Tax=Polytomella parva TaxID=51329 RepID=A0A7S0V8E4_9CHLO|mmetsp:Transcript_27924/g.51602  ORF Transcript_27924/g.51602 Transcript_27924/m.51602 type:complete len:160 (+) Transcript_27924:94-573(+)
MSRRKHVTNELFQEVKPPKENEFIVQVLGLRGGNIVNVQFPDGKETLCLLPSKFHKKVWVKRGGFVLIESDENAFEDTKVAGNILAVLYDEQIKEYKKLGVWPGEFKELKGDKSEKDIAVEGLDLPEFDDSDDDLPPLERNVNRRVIQHSNSDDESDNE